MSKRFCRIAIGFVGALVGLTFLTLALTANTPAQATMADSSIAVSITESGFDPTLVTITVGTTVTWTNHTQEMVHMVSGEPYRIYLPLVLSNVGGARTTAVFPPMAAATQQRDDWVNVDIAPGESYSHTFTTVGNYSYFLAEHPNRTAIVIVQPIPCSLSDAGRWERAISYLGADFTVSSDQSRVENFEFEMSPPINSCGFRRLTVSELPIIDCQIEVITTSNDIEIRVSGTFTVGTQLYGDYFIEKTGCKAWAYGVLFSQWVSDTRRLSNLPCAYMSITPEAAINPSQTQADH
jgi:plastocyanin